MPGWFQLAQEEAAKPVWGVFVEGNAMAFIVMVVFVGIVYWMIARARAGLPVREIRKIAGLDAVDEAIGRATEMGRPVHFAPGIQGITNPQTISSFGALAHVARTCARYDTRLIHTSADVPVYLVSQEVVRQGYLEAGRPDAFNPDDVRWLTDWQFAYAAAVFGIFQRERPAANIMWGSWFAESLMFIENAAMIGAVTIGATTNTAQLPFFIAAADYTLIGEEMFAASAYLSKEPVLVGTVVGQDIAKMIVFGLVILGTIIQNVSEKNFLTDLLSK